MIPAKNSSAHGSCCHIQVRSTEGVEAISGEPRFELECRRMFEHERAVQLPPGIAPKPARWQE